jgi:hypothetical protein
VAPIAEGDKKPRDRAEEGEKRSMFMGMKMAISGKELGLPMGGMIWENEEKEVVRVPDAKVDSR